MFTINILTLLLCYSLLRISFNLIYNNKCTILNKKYSFKLFKDNLKDPFEDNLNDTSDMLNLHVLDNLVLDSDSDSDSDSESNPESNIFTNLYNYNNINTDISKKINIKRKLVAGYDERYPLNTNITEKLISLNDKIYQINNNILKHNLLNKLLEKKISKINKINFIVKNNYLFNSTTFDYINDQLKNSIKPINLLAGGLGKELEEWFINNKTDQ
jgi:hypothetical protein